MVFKVTNMYVARRKKGLSQMTLAEMVGKSQAAISNLENGIIENPETLEKVSQILGIPANQLTEEYHSNAPSSI